MNQISANKRHKKYKEKIDAEKKERSPSSLEKGENPTEGESDEKR